MTVYSTSHILLLILFERAGLFGSELSSLLYLCQGCISVLRATCRDIGQTTFGIVDQQQVNAVRAHASARLLVDR